MKNNFYFSGVSDFYAADKKDEIKQTSYTAFIVGASDVQDFKLVKEMLDAELGFDIFLVDFEESEFYQKVCNFCVNHEYNVVVDLVAIPSCAALWKNRKILTQYVTVDNLGDSDFDGLLKISEEYKNEEQVQNEATERGLTVREYREAYYFNPVAFDGVMSLFGWDSTSYCGAVKTLKDFVGALFMFVTAKKARRQNKIDKVLEQRKNRKASKIMRFNKGRKNEK